MTPEHGRSIGHEIRQIIATEGDRNHQGTPQWLNFTRAREIMDEQRNPFPDEADLIVFAALMLRTRGVYLRGHGTKEAHDLGVRHQQVMSNPAEHLSAVLQRQRREVTQFLAKIANPNHDPEKRFRSLQRGIGRREEVMIRKLDLLDRIEDRQLLAVISAAITGKRCRDLPQSRSELVADILRLNREIIQIAEDAELQLALIRRRDAAKRALERIDDQLTRLPRTEVAEDAPAEETTPAAPKKQQKEPKCRNKKRRAPEESNSQNLKPDTKESDPNVEMRTDIERLMDLTQGQSRVRVIVPSSGNNSRNKPREWSELLRKLGYTGELIFVTYEQVRRGDTSPIIVGRNINTHKDIWAGNVGSASVHVITFPPNVLASYLKVSAR